MEPRFLPNWPNQAAINAADDSNTLAQQWQIGGNDPNDKIWFTFSATAPALTEGYSFDFAFFSSEWPTYVNTTFNDLFVAWVVTDSFTGNISVINNQPTTITALHSHWSNVPVNQGSKTCANFGSAGPGFSCNEPQLAGTGYETHAATDWTPVNQNIESGTNLDIYFFVSDMGDTALASAVALDNFRWRCMPCIDQDDPDYVQECLGEIQNPDCCGVILPQ